jgi:hypothetical protein
MNIKNILSSLRPQTAQENWQHDATSLTWNYADRRRTYQVIARNNEAVVKFEVLGKYNAEVTLEGEQARAIQNLLQKLENLHIPAKPTPPVKPTAPRQISFESAATKEKKSSEYSKQYQSYILKCEKYDTAMINYNSRVSLHNSNKKLVEKTRKDLISNIDRIFDQSMNLLRQNKIPC